MANPLELTRYIRYQLSELGARNAHHEFEHLTRHLARLRVCSNIMPATGPVSAGGDGGRDFETFKTYNDIPLTPDSSFQRFASGQREIAFACSLQKKIIPKIRKEFKGVKTIGKYKDMVFFCEENLPVSKRHTLQKEAEHIGIDLQIFDGTAIAELLSDRDTFWIAQSYLQIPSDLMPSSDESLDWYQELVAKWKYKQPLPFSYSDFSELKFGVRRSTFHEAARPDLKMWIEKLQTYREKPSPRELHRWASYEIIVASFRGTGSFDGLEQIVLDYFSDLEANLGTGDLMDAVNLRNYLIGANGAGIYPITAPSLPKIQERLVKIFEAGIVDAPGPGRRADLLQLLGMVHLSILKEGKTDLETVAGYWDRMLDEAEQSKFFPTRKFNAYYAYIFDLLGNPPELTELAPRLDELIAKRSGSKEAGENAEERGDKYKNQKNMTGALKEYQRARKRFYDGGDQPALIRVVLKMADSFRSLGLSYGAKYYALSAAWMSANPSIPALRKYLPDALLSVSEMEYSSGNFVGFAHYAYLSRAAELLHSNVESPSPIAENIGHIYGLLGLLKRKSPEHYENLKSGFSEWPRELFGDLFEISSAPGFWDEGLIEDITSDMSAMLVDRPWGDLAETREVRWSALGINWRCTFKNDYITTVAAEDFISQIQIAVSAIAIEKADLILIPTNLSLTLSIASPGNNGSMREAEFDDGKWNIKIDLPIKNQSSKASRNQLSVIVKQIIAKFSLFDTRDFLSHSSAWFKSFLEIGFSFRSYEEVFAEFTPEKGTFTEKIKLSSNAPFEFTGLGSEFKSLPEFSGIAPSYDRNKQLAIISDRYIAAIPNIQHTARNLLSDTLASDFFKSLRSDGMKDWYLLCIVSGMAINVRGAEKLKAELTQEVAEQLLNISRKTETPQSALNPEDFDLRYLPAFELGFAPLLMSSLDLSQDHDLLNDPKTLKTIKQRFNLRVDDVDHPEIFVWA
ncbi:hypothetical protein [Pseudomonas putida]|uniref:hypothetical protein n=1 Tax=Pseudomonas putida TaxID=303 RepID=UPI00216A69C2|nr:hypothetical protein [Pseudomonas putida]MCS4065452.1 hypothetical protein [Pseudomonas putida]